MSVHADVISDLSIEEIGDLDSEKQKKLLAMQERNQIGVDTLSDDISFSHMQDLYSNISKNNNQAYNKHSREPSDVSDLSSVVQLDSINSTGSMSSQGMKIEILSLLSSK